MTPQLLGNAYRVAPETMAPHDTTTALLDLSDGKAAILAAMRRSTRRNVRSAQRRALTVRDGDKAACRSSRR